MIPARVRGVRAGPAGLPGAAQPARFLRVTSTAAAGTWWSIADLRLYA